MEDPQQYVVDAIRGFLERSDGPWDWDDFTSISLRSATLDSIRLRARAINLPLDPQGEAELTLLLEEAQNFTDEDIEKPKAWRTATGAAYGLIVGIALWWGSYIPGSGLFENLKLIVLPTALGMTIVLWRNRRLRVGEYDPEIAAANRRGRV